MKRTTLLGCFLLSAASSAFAQSMTSSAVDMNRSGEPIVEYEREDNGNKLEIELRSGNIPSDFLTRREAVATGPRFGVRYDYEYRDGRKSVDRYEMEVIIVDKTESRYGAATTLDGRRFTLLDGDYDRQRGRPGTPKSASGIDVVYRTTEEYLITRDYLDAVASGKETTLTLSGPSGSVKVPMSAAVAKKFIDAIDKAKTDYRLTSINRPKSLS